MKTRSMRSRVLEELELLASGSAQLAYEASLTEAGHAPTELIAGYSDDLFNPKDPALVADFSNEELKELAQLYGLMQDAFQRPPSTVSEMHRSPGWRKVMAFAKDLHDRLRT
jgi:hypothetical protein